MWQQLKTCIDDESSVNCGEFDIGGIQLSKATPSLDMTSVVLPNASDLISDNNNESCEISFTRFLSADFVKHPFILASKLCKRSVHVSEDRESTPIKFDSKENHCHKSSSEVWGSPLKTDFAENDSLVFLETSNASLPTKKRTPTRLGIALKSGRKLLNSFNINCETTCTIPTVLLLCDSKDRQKIVLSGVKIFPVQKGNKSCRGMYCMYD